MPFRLNARLCFSWSLMFALTLAARGATAATNGGSWIRLPWSSADGLPNNTVGGLAQTPDGFIWVGTPNGLARFDGVRFEEVPTTNFVPLPHRGVLTMASGRAGGLHLGTDRGAVVSLSANRWKTFLPDPERSTWSIYSLTEDVEGAVWVCYRNGRVQRVADGQCQVMGEAEAFPAGPEICSMTCEPDGRLWYLKRGRLGVWRGNRFELLREISGRNGRLTAAREGGVWACVDFRLFKFKEGGELVHHGSFLPRLPGTEVSVMLEGRNGILWIGTTFSGLYRYDGKTFEVVATTHQEIVTLLEDAEGNIWVGMGGGGLNQVRPRAVTLEAADAGLPAGVSSLCQDVDGVLWAATQNGDLARNPGDRWEVIPPDATWSGNALSVCAEPTGGIWVGMRAQRLLRWKDGRFVNWGDPEQITGQTIHTMVVATNGDLWLGEDTPVAVQRLREGKAKNYELPLDPQDVRVIRASVQDSAGNVWFGTSKGVLLRVVGDRLVDETAATIGAPQPIRCLYATPDGSLWIGFDRWGVGRIKNGRYASVSARQGMHDDGISQIIADDHGWVWFGGDRGIFKVRQEELDGVCDGKLNRVRSVHYGPFEYGLVEGRPSLQAVMGNAPIALRSRDGRVRLAMRTALAVIDPEMSPQNPRPPPVVLTRMAVGDRTIASYGRELAVASREPGVLDLSRESPTVKIAPNHRRLEFEFTALSYVGIDNIVFRYRLEGFDDEWMETRLGRNAIYPRLPRGKYEFQVIACNSEGIWNRVGATLTFVVRPFIWQTWWFQTIVVLTFTALVIALVRYWSFRRLRAQLQSLEQQAALYKERARIAKDIHDDLGASLTQISLLGELAQQDREAPAKVGDHVGVIQNTARRAVKSLDEIVWAVNPRNDTLAHFIDYTGQFALDYLRLAGVRCRLDLPEQAPTRDLSTDVRHNLFLVVKEAINNTVKYAQATELRLRIAVSEEKLELTVEDDGCGFTPPPEEADADGLRNMRQRMADIGGRCWIQGRPGAGAKISIEYPWPRDRRKAGD